MTETSPEVTTDTETRRTSSAGWVRWGLAAVVLVAAGVGGAVVWKQAKPVVEAQKYRSVEYTVPTAPQLTAKAGETVYRVDPTRSSLTYGIDEKFAGASSSRATGVTNGIAGDVALNGTSLDKSRVGDVVVNVEQFHSDNNLRDARIRADYLESAKFPLATFKLAKITGLSGPLTQGKTYDFTIDGIVTIKGTPVPATFKARGSVKNGTLTLTATTKAKLSRFDAGPISIGGLVTTSDDVDLTLKLVALDPATHAIPTRITGPHAKAPAGTPTSFEATVQPILENNCASCHNAGEIGAHQWKLDTAGDARSIADGLKTVTHTRYMPPWPASDKGVKLAHNQSLTNAQIKAIADWVDGGAGLDVPATTKIRPPKAQVEAMPRRDKTLRIPAYTGSISNTNDYRCFVLDPKITTPMYLTGYAFLGDQLPEIHHAQVFHISGSQAAAAKQISGKDGQPGWSCYSGPNLPGRFPKGKPGHIQQRRGFSGQAGLVAGWVPGQTPTEFPLKSGIYMNAGDQLVMQLHYHFSGTPIPDRSALAVQLDPVTPATRMLRVLNPVAPVELPCSPADQAAPLCDRTAAIKDDARLYGTFGAVVEPGLLGLCGLTVEGQQARFDGTTGATTCNYQVPEDGTLVNVFGHMHTLGKTFRMTYQPGTPQQKILLDIPHWSFDWQMNYELAKPMKVKAGDVIRMDCSWDRSLDPARPPKYIVFAEGTEDEMCFGTYALIPDSQ